jgi:outer membrane protein assembly factor BamB
MTIAKRLGMLEVLGMLLLASRAPAQDWPQWRGPNRDNHVTGFTAPTMWPKELHKKWSVKVGEGVSSPVLVGDKLYVFGRPDGNSGEEVTLCLDANTGKQIWEHKSPAPDVKGAATRFQVAGTRSTPAVGDGKVCTLGVGGLVTCLDAATGKLVWSKDTKSKPLFYTSSSPLISDGMCIFYVGALTAYDLATGEPKWQWKGGQTPYGSPVLMTVDGVKQVVTPTKDTLVGVGLADGKLLWEVKLPGFDYTISYGTPIIDGQTVIYAAPGKGGGMGKGGKGKGGPAKGGKGGGGGNMIAYKIEKMGDKFTANDVWKVNECPYMYNTPVLKDSLLFGLSGGKTFFCMDAKTGKTLWTDTTNRGETGGILNAGSVILALTGTSELVAFEPSSKGYTEVAKYQVSSTPGLAYPIVAGDRIYVKGSDSLSLWTLQ